MKIEILTDEMIENAVTRGEPIEGDAVIFTCDRDHCTPEERAVIEQAISWSIGYSLRPDTNSIDDGLFFVVQQLLAARAGRDLKWTGVGDETQ